MQIIFSIYVHAALERRSENVAFERETDVHVSAPSVLIYIYLNRDEGTKMAHLLATSITISGKKTNMR